MPTQRPSAERIALLSIPVALVVMGVKYVAYARTGSVALYSDAVESVVNVAAALAAWLAIRIAARPADEDHPYGHQKAEYFAAGFEGALVVLAAVQILRVAWDAWQEPRTLEHTGEGLAWNAFAGVLNGLWAWFLIARGRRLASPALVADGWHLASDVLSSVGVIAGLVLALATGWSWLDPLLAAAVALNVLWAGWSIVGRSVAGLMDESAGPEIRARIERAITENSGPALQVHDLRARRAGQTTFVEFHLVVAGDTSVRAAHELCDRIEDAIRLELGGAEVLIHVEPEHEAEHSGALRF